MRPILISACALLAASCATAGATPPDGTEAIAFERKSWGKPINAWQVGADGEGRYTFSRKAPSGKFRDYDLVTKRISVGPQGYAELERILRPAEAAAGSELPCERRITDLPYGTVRWEKDAAAAELRYDVGCQSEEAGRVISALVEADKLVEGWAADAPVADVEEVREPTG